MRTREQIVQELLNDKKITAEDAVVLLSTQKEYVYIPQPYQVYPVYPVWPNVTWRISSGNAIADSGNYYSATN